MRRVIAGAVASAVILIGGIVVGGVIGAVVNERLVGHSTEVVGIAFSLAAALAGVAVGGAVWGWAISRITGAGGGARMAWAGAIGFAPAVVLVAVGLTFFENLIVEQGQGPALPIHTVFTLLFVPAATLVSGAGAFALRVGARAGRPRVALVCAVCGGAAFLVVNLTLDALGWRVGAPGAAERATMITTALLGSFSTAFVSGGLVAMTLVERETTLRAPALG